MRRQRSVPIHAQALNILHSYGTNAHLYLPGVGVVNGITAGNWLDSAGTTPATVDNPVGLVIDAAGSVGPELVTNGDFSAGTSLWAPINGASLSASSGVLTITNGNYGGIIQGFTAGIGKTYRVSITRAGGTAAGRKANICGVIFDIAATETVQTIKATANDIAVFIDNPTAGETLLIDNISVKEITGIHASQNTTASKPILRSTAGIQSWQFDGADDYLSLGSVPFQMADDHCVVAGVNTQYTGANWQTAFSIGGTGGSVRVQLGLAGANATPVIAYRNDALSLVTITSPTQGVVGPAVLSAKATSATAYLRVNGIQKASGAVPSSPATFTASSIGSLANASGVAADWLQGHSYPVIAIKGTVSDADLLTLEKFVGSLSGVTV